MNQMDAIVGIDIGGTKIAVSIQGPDEKLIHSFRISTESESQPECLIGNVLDQIETASIEHNLAITAVGIGCPGPLNIEKGLVLSPTNLQNWIEFPVVDMIRNRLGVPVVLDNDANAAAIGECHFGAGRGFRRVLYVTISTGIGGALVIDGNIYRGFESSAGEVGHTVVKYDGELCLCGTIGCLETISSGKSIVRQVGDRLSNGADSLIRKLSVDNEIDTKMVVAAVEQGDPLACSVWDDACKFLGIGIGNAITLFAPDAVVVGGGVTHAGDLLFTPMIENIKMNVNMLPIDNVKIVPAMLGVESGTLGAIRLAQLNAIKKLAVESVEI